MRKKVLTLICIMTMVLVPSMGVLAEESQGGPSEQQDVTSEQKKAPDEQSQEMTSEQPNGSPEGQTSQTDNNEIQETPDENTLPGDTSNGAPEQTEENNGAAPDLYSAQETVSTLANDPEEDPGTEYMVYVDPGNGRTAVGRSVTYTHKGAEGEIIWNDDTHTLEFRNYVFKASPNAKSYNSFKLTINKNYPLRDDELTIILTGNNYIETPDNDIVIHIYGKSLHIMGDGSLTLTSPHSSFGSSVKELNIDGVTLIINSTDADDSAGIRGIGCVGVEADGSFSTNTDRVINITNSTVKGENLTIFSQGDIQFNGKSVVEATGLFGSSAITAYGKILFALAEGGKVTAVSKGSSEYGLGAALMSFGGIELAEGSLANGKITSKEVDGVTVYYFVSEDGTILREICVEGGNIEKLNMPIETTTAAAKQNPTGGLPQTGDSAQTVLWLMVLLAGAVCVTAVTRLRKSR